MNRDDYARLKDIVSGALSRPGRERSAYVTAECGSNAALRLEAENLLPFVELAEPLFEDAALSLDGAPLTLGALDRIDVAVPFTVPLDGSSFRSVVEEHFGGTERYAVRRRIGAGGMGIVYEVDDRARGQVVALKTLRSRQAADIYQLKREFRNLADVAHPNLVTLYDLVVDDALCFFTMELVEGTTFVEFVRQASPEATVADRARRALPQLIGGVLELHRRGMQHRDIKPPNVLVTGAGRVVILDFGLTSGRVQEGPGSSEFAGTPAYLSPEQCLGAVASNATDWYGVGATLYHALAGRAPFDGPLRDIIERKTTLDPPPVSALSPDIPTDLADLCMGLLDRNPALRTTGREALARLAEASATDEGAGTADSVFVGRESFLRALDDAFRDVASGRGASVFIYGPSGIGKSALVQRFIDRQLARNPCLVLRGRCHEHESIPYNGLDGVIDSLTRHLAALPPSVLREAMPAGAPALARLFPVMRALGVEPDPAEDMADPIRLRGKAFSAFRELIGRLAARHPIIIDIDDFHWADADSVRWLMELLRPPSLPALLSVVSFRSEELEAKPFLGALIERVDIGERLALPLTPMSAAEVTALVAAVLPAGAEALHEATIAGDGNPFLVDALARHAALGAGSGGQASLDEMLMARISTLPPESRVFLETLAVCGRPEMPARIFGACGIPGDERPLVARLKAAHLLRNSQSAERVEMYHDRIRETLAGRVSDSSARHIHDLMARELVRHGDDDPEALFEHYRAAGHTALAATQAAAAGAKAAGVLAFDLAVTFYRHALALQPNVTERVAWLAELARALENAGRPAEAADAYLDAAKHGRQTEQIEWRRKAGELFLIGGQIDRGLAVIDDVLRMVGMRLPRGPRTAVLSLALRRGQLRWRGLDFTPRAESRIDPEELLRIDACWSISAGLALVDPVRAAAFNVRQLLKALDVGDPYRVARALALEGGFSLVGLGAGIPRSVEFSERAEALAAAVGHRYVPALTSLWSGIGAFLTGQWRRAADLCGRAATTLQDECTGVIWELNMANNFYLGALLYQGEMRDVARLIPGLLQSSRERGNFYMELELNTRMILAWLASDDPDAAERRANEAIARWSHKGFQRQHFGYLLNRLQTELYRGRAREAWRLMSDHQAPLRRSLLLRVQHTRLEAANNRARCALAMAAEGHDVSRMRAVVLYESKRIRRENMPWSNPMAHLALATLAYQQGDLNAAVEGLTEAVTGFDSANMGHYAAGTRRRLGTVVGGDQGRALLHEADRWMASQEIRNPMAMTRLLAPGFRD